MPEAKRKPGFQKGQSGNPAGRKKGVPNKATAEVKELARQHGADVIAILLKIAKNEAEPPAARVSACKELLDRGYGRAPQAVEHSGNVGLPPLSIVLGKIDG